MYKNGLQLNQGDQCKEHKQNSKKKLRYLYGTMSFMRKQSSDIYYLFLF